MHFFAPAHIMKLLENIRGCTTSAETISTAMHLGRQMKKVPVSLIFCEKDNAVVKNCSFSKMLNFHIKIKILSEVIYLSQVLVGNCAGFVGNRMFFLYSTEADFLLEDGAYPEQVRV